MEESMTFFKEVRLRKGKILTIRDVTPEDAEKIVAYMYAIGGESDNLTFGSDDLNLTVQQETEFIENLQKDGRSLMLTGVIDGEIVSITTLKCPERKRVRHNAEFSITVKKDYWGIGVGNTMMQELIGYARDRGDIKNINLGVRAGNDRAVSLYEKHGFVKIGVTKDFFCFGNTYCDAILMDLYL